MRFISRTFVSAALAIAIVSCTKEPKAPAESAAEYYKALAAEDYESFVNGMYSTSHVADSYRKEKLLIVKQFYKGQVSENGGIKEATASRDTIYDDGSADAFLNISYENGTTEEIVVAMVREGETWKMK